jgi:HEAT repeat protein
MDVLLGHLSDPDEALRSQILESIHRLRLRRSHLTLPQDQVRKTVMLEIQNLYEQWFLQWDLKLPPDAALLLEALESRRETTLKRIFRLLGCLFPVRSVDVVYNNLTSPRRATRANAIELLDNMLDKEFKRLLLPLLDDSMRDNRRAIGREVLGLDHQDQLHHLSALMEQNMAWLASCAVFTTGQMQKEELAKDVLACTASEIPIVRETALMALRKLMPPEQLRTTVERHLKDPASTVREYASYLLEGISST